MKRIFFIDKLAIILLACLAGACATSIGNKTDLQDANLEIGVTHKSQVAELLGFPVAMKKDDKKGIELWAYHDKPQLSGLYYGVPTGTTTATMYTVSVANENPEFNNAALICTFSGEGILQQLYWNKGH